MYTEPIVTLGLSSWRADPLSVTASAPLMRPVWSRANGNAGRLHHQPPGPGNESAKRRRGGGRMVVKREKWLSRRDLSAALAHTGTAMRDIVSAKSCTPATIIP